MSFIGEVRSDQHTGVYSVASPIEKSSFDQYLSPGISISPKTVSLIS